MTEAFYSHVKGLSSHPPKPEVLRYHLLANGSINEKMRCSIERNLATLWTMHSPSTQIRIVPLGGFGQIGMNCLAIEISNQILVVDCGVLFPNEPKLGVDTIHPSFAYLLEKREQIVGLVATHGHEDHIAAIPYLLEQLNIPIFAGAYTIELLKARLCEFPHIGNVEFTIIDADEPFNIQDFRITPIAIPHSTIDNFGLVIEHGKQRIFHTSDYKLDVYSPGYNSNILQKLRTIRPIDLMITDSTGSLETEDAGNEDHLIDNIGLLVQNAPGRVFVALFSSNITRIRNLAKVANNTGRKLAMSGRSVNNHFSIAQKTGNIESFGNVVIPINKTSHFRNDQLLILLSGTQGESRSALGRFAANRHGDFSVQNSDTVILSSRFIPGNELQIARTISRLMEQNVTVFHRNNQPNIHVSGHGSKNEIRTVMDTVCPKAVLPAHGTYEHMHATQKIANQAGIANTIVARNGDIVLFDHGQLRIETSVPHEKVFIENGKSLHESVLKERRMLCNNGVFFIHLCLTHTSPPKLTKLLQHCLGVVSPGEISMLYEQTKQTIVQTLKSTEKRPPLHPDWTQILKTALRKQIRTEHKRNPFFIIEIEWL